MKSIFIDINEEKVIQGWGSSPSSATSIKVEVVDDHPVLNGAFRNFIYENGEIVKSDSIILGKLKRRKDAEFNEACKQAILEGFLHTIDGVTYWFSFDQEAQVNFQGSRDLLVSGLTESINWTVRVGGKNGEYSRIPITKEIMDGISLSILLHKDEKISRYRDVLLPQLDAATTIEEVNAITWNE